VNFGWTWLWCAGIVTSSTVIFMFAVFEKKRSEVMRVVEGLKERHRSTIRNTERDSIVQDRFIAAVEKS
jgi:hypothetical protein